MRGPKRTKLTLASTLLTAVVATLLVLSMSGCAAPAATPTAAAPTAAPAPAGGTPAPAAAGGKTINIGVLLPLTGGSSTIGVLCKAGYELGQEIVNNEGGIKSMGGAKLNFVFADTASKPDVAVSQAERLITKEKMPMLEGAFNSSATFPATEVAEKYKIPWLVLGAVRDDLTDRGFKYLFRPNYKSIQDVYSQFFAVDAFDKEFKKPLKTVALLYEATDWGTAHMENVKKLLAERGIKVVVDEGFPAEAADLTPQILKTKAANPDAIFIAVYTPQGILLANGLAENKVNSTVISAGASTSEPGFFKAVGNKVDYWYTVDEWEVGITNVKTWAKPINEEFKKKAGEDMNAFAAQAWTNVWITVDVLERAGSTDPEKLREALAATKIDGSMEGKGVGRALLMPWKSITFGPDGQNPEAKGTLTQIVGGKKFIAFPAEYRDPAFKLVYPPPPWDQRK